MSIFQKFQTPVTFEPEHVETQTQLGSIAKISALLSVLKKVRLKTWEILLRRIVPFKSLRVVKPLGPPLLLCGTLVMGITCQNKGQIWLQRVKVKRKSGFGQKIWLPDGRWRSLKSF